MLRPISEQDKNLFSLNSVLLGATTFTTDWPNILEVLALFRGTLVHSSKNTLMFSLFSKYSKILEITHFHQNLPFPEEALPIITHKKFWYF